MSHLVPTVMLVFLAITLVGVGIATNKGKIDRNLALGVRTRATLSSDESWKLAHKRMFPFLVSGGIVATSFALVLLLMQVNNFDTGALNVMSAASFLTVLAIVIVGGFVADSSARTHTMR